MIDVATARRLVVSDVTPLPAELVGLGDAVGRVLAADVFARHDQPAASVSAMDGYAVRADDVVQLPASLAVAGISKAGGRPPPPLGGGEAVRIFTGAALPAGADTIVIQEETDAVGDRVRIRAAPPAGRYIRGAGGDFRTGERLLAAGRRLDPRAVALAAAGGAVWLRVRRQPRIAILATGDELVLPGEADAAGRTINSNSLLLAGEIRRAGGIPMDLGVAGDDRAAIADAIVAASGADALVTLGGASVGDFDLVGEGLAAAGYRPVFERVAMRPGKPTGFGRLSHLSSMPVLVLPGNPVSAAITARLFLLPLMAALMGLAGDDGDSSQRPAELATPLAANDRRQDYLRATITPRPGRIPLVEAFSRQDSALLRLYADANALIVRPPFAPAAAPGQIVPVLHLD
ncbi:MAG: gephyrin-like molybdotransferase Glp [Rhodospirillales bacterium]